jgi:hypothetical protein
MSFERVFPPQFGTKENKARAKRGANQSLYLIAEMIKKDHLHGIRGDMNIVCRPDGSPSGTTPITPEER